MDDADFMPFRGNLDPRAQEFLPRNPYTHALPSLQFYYPSHPHPPSLQYGEFSGYPRPAYPPPIPAPCLPPQSSIPTRTMLVSMVPPDVSESLVRRELEVFGDVRAVQMERVREGIVTVHFYDLRHAQSAVAEIREQHMQQQYRLRRHYESGAGVALPPPLPPPDRGLIAGRVVWAQFMIPVTCNIPEGNNQGTLVLLNLDPRVSAHHLKDTFRAFGDVKEVRETPRKEQQRFVEFYDVRDAANALMQMNHKEINGKPVLIEYSRPGGHYRRRTFSKPIPFSPPPSPSATAPSRCPNTTPNNANHGNDGFNGSTPNSNSRTTNSKKSWKKSSKNSGSSSLSPSLKRRGKAGRSSNVGGNEHDPRFMINEEEIKDAADGSRDGRTTVMIKNIPNKYSQKLLLNMLDNHCIHCNEQIADGASASASAGHDQHLRHPKSSYDFVYLPIDFINKCNVGYSFVNMTSPEAAWRLYKAFHLQTWEAFNSRKICEVTYARIQGIEALKEHFKNSRFPCEREEYMPVVFTPPRDGRTLTAPVPIFGPPLVICPSPSTVSSKEEEVEESDDGNLPAGLEGLAINEHNCCDDTSNINDGGGACSGGGV